MQEPLGSRQNVAWVSPERVDVARPAPAVMRLLKTACTRMVAAMTLITAFCSLTSMIWEPRAGSKALGHLECNFRLTFSSSVEAVSPLTVKPGAELHLQYLERGLTVPDPVHCWGPLAETAPVDLLTGLGTIPKFHSNV